MNKFVGIGLGIVAAGSLAGNALMFQRYSSAKPVVSMGSDAVSIKDFRDRLAVVVFAWVVAAADPHAPTFFAQVPAVGIGEEGLHRRSRVGEHPFSWLLMIRCCLRCGFA